MYVTCARDEHTMVGMLVYSNFYHDRNTFNISAPRLSRAPRLSHSLRSLHHTRALSTLPGPRPRTLPSLGAAVPPEQRRDAGMVVALGLVEGGFVGLHRTQAPSAAPHPPGGVPLTLSLAFTSARAPRSAPATAS